MSNGQKSDGEVFCLQPPFKREIYIYIYLACFNYVREINFNLILLFSFFLYWQCHKFIMTIAATFLTEIERVATSSFSLWALSINFKRCGCTQHDLDWELCKNVLSTLCQKHLTTWHVAQLGGFFGNRCYEYAKAVGNYHF